ncbi:MAG: hypothetical protein JXQ23_10965, partial [Clostridia bacterium]|nr:hypothetical protein [Clostridia bacterium]
MKNFIILSIIILCFAFTSYQESELLPSSKPETSLVIQSTDGDDQEFKIDEMNIFTSSNFSPETIGEWESYLLDKFNI